MWGEHLIAWGTLRDSKIGWILFVRWGGMFSAGQDSTAKDGEKGILEHP